MSVLAQRDGWTLSAWRWPRSGSLLRHVYQLDGLTNGRAAPGHDRPVIAHVVGKP